MGLKESGLRGSLRNVSVGIVAIPDSDIYLQDDWGDGKFQDRDGSGTTTHNGVEGVYRPEWSVLAGSPEVISERFVIESDEEVTADINLNFDETITWVWNADFSNNGGGGIDLSNLHLFTEDPNNTTDRVYHASYALRCRTLQDDEDIIFNKVDESGSFSEFGRGGNLSGSHEIKVTRDPSGNFELTLDGSSITTGSDTEFTDPVAIGFTGREDSRVDVDEMKVS